jgi:rhodanese-related sulfurtransferase
MSDMTEPSLDEASVDRGASATPIVVGMLVLAFAAIAYMALGMPGMDHSTSMSSHAMTTHRGHRVLDPIDFRAAMSVPGAMVINVHVPTGEVGLDGTDLEMPFDAIDPAVLPTDRSTPLAIYCRSGAMSSIAVSRLIDLGYTNVAELDGGTQAWDSPTLTPEGSPSC